MSDFTSSTVLYHPTGARCNLVLPSDPKEAFDMVTAYIDAGFLANVPIPKEGQRCHIDYVIRCKFIHNNKQGERLYFYDLSSQFSSSAMTVYLDDPDIIKAFERASGLTVESMPFVEGKLVPTSDSGAFFQQYACPVNFTVLREKVDVTAENPNGRWKLIDYVDGKNSSFNAVSSPSDENHTSDSKIQSTPQNSGNSGTSKTPPQLKAEQSSLAENMPIDFSKNPPPNNAHDGTQWELWLKRQYTIYKKVRAS